MPRLDYLDYVKRKTGLWVPKPLGFAQRRCCCGACIDCSLVCIECTTPAQYQVVLAGISANGKCGNCGDLNDTYVVTRDDNSPCNAYYSFDSAICTVDQLKIWHAVVGFGPDVMPVVDALVGGGMFARWYDTGIGQTPLYDCGGYSSEVLPLKVAGATQCSFTGSTATLTSL